jgi:hypothetical protein
MEATPLPWLTAVVGTIASIAVVLLIAVNGLFALGVLLKADRGFVDRWTKPLVITDAALLLAAVGTPIVGVAIKLAAKGLVVLATLPAKLVPTK